MPTGSTVRAPRSDLHQLGAQCVQPRLIEGRRLDVDVRRIDLDGRHVEAAPGQLGKDLLGDADAVGKEHIDTHACSP